MQRTTEVESITKLDAAERQIRTAVRLFFQEGDSVSICTLARAGSEILRDIGNTRGIKDPLLDSDVIKPEYIAEVQRKIREPQNFFKHANRDLDAVLDLKPRVPELFLAFACNQLLAVAEQRPPETVVFMSWFLVQHPDLIEDSFRDEHLARAHQAGLVTGKKDAALKLLDILLDFEAVGPWPLPKDVATDPFATRELIQRTDRLKKRRGSI